MKTLQEFLTESKIGKEVSVSFSQRVDMNTKIKSGKIKNVMDSGLYDSIVKKFGKGNSVSITKKDKAIEKNKIEINKKTSSQIFSVFGDYIMRKSEDSSGKSQTNFYELKK